MKGGCRGPPPGEGPPLSPVAPATPASVPATIGRDDAEARLLLQRAQGAFQKWPEVFGGFRARLTVDTAAREAVGAVRVGARGEVILDLSDSLLAGWALHALQSLVAERIPCFFKDGDGRFPIAFDGHADGARGRRVVVQRARHGLGDIRYEIDERARVRGRAAVEGDELHVHTYESFARATPGRLLPRARSTSVSRHGRVLRRELLEDAHARVGDVWLPLERRVQVSALEGTLVWRLRLHDHRVHDQAPR